MVRRVWIWSVLGIMMLVLLLIFVVPYFCPWSELNCHHEEVDINSGRLRFTQYLLFCKVSERVEDSSLTNALPPEVLTGIKPEWRLVNTFSPGVHHSPHYTFHGAIYQIHRLSLLWDAYDLPRPVRQKTALHVLEHWRHGRNDLLANDYLRELDKVLESEERSQAIDTILHIEMPESKSEQRKTVE